MICKMNTNQKSVLVFMIYKMWTTHLHVQMYIVYIITVTQFVDGII